MRNARTTRRRSVTVGLPAALLVLLLAVFAAGCGGSDDTTGSRTPAPGGGKLDVVGYSTPEAVYAGSPRARPSKRPPKGAGVSFSNSFGASGDQSRAVAAGQPASVVHFSQAGDMERLVEEGELVAKDWDKQQYDGIAQDSVVVIMVRKGNPEGIESLRRPAEQGRRRRSPRTRSARARPAGTSWPSTAPQINEGKSPDEALAAVKTAARKDRRPAGQRPRRARRLHPGRGRRAARLRERGDQGPGRRRRRRIRRSRPATILIETPIAVTKDAPEPAAQDFLDYIWSDAGQEIWAENGYRPVNPKLVDPKQFPTPKDLFTIAEFGGWGKVNDEFFDDETGSVADDREGTRGLHQRLMEGHPATLPAAAPHRAGSSACPGSAPASAAAWSCLYLIAHRPAAAGGGRRRIAEPAASAPSGTRSPAPQAMAALKLTVICSLIVVAINAIFGTIIAWVLVRDEFPGKSIVNAVIDLPFALPTIVASLTLLTLYGADSPLGVDIAFTRAAIVVALCFVTLPFVVRAVQPLLMEMDREMEEAAASLGAGGFTVFRRIIFPNLLPGILAGVAARLRARAGRVRLADPDLAATSPSRPRSPRSSSAARSSPATTPAPRPSRSSCSSSRCCCWSRSACSCAGAPRRSRRLLASARPRRRGRTGDDRQPASQLGPAGLALRLPRPAAARPRRR